MEEEVVDVGWCNGYQPNCDWLKILVQALMKS
jgi:hypothetical protein